jgi:hypothetical protein
MPPTPPVPQFPKLVVEAVKFRKEQMAASARKFTRSILDIL